MQFGDEDISFLCQLHAEIIDCLIPRLPSLALLKLQEALPLNYENEHGVGSGEVRESVKGSNIRCENFDTAWMTIYKSRFSGLSLTKPENCS